MTDKRFCVEDYDLLMDTQEKRLYGAFADDTDKVCDLLNELYEENMNLKNQLRLVCRSESCTPHCTVKNIVRDEIEGIDTVSYESYGAWNDYCVLSKCFSEQYGEKWND